jgi:hypothetical protein
MSSAILWKAWAKPWKSQSNMSVPCMYSNLYLLNANHIPYRSQKLPRYVVPQFIILISISYNLYVLLISYFNTYRAVTSNKAIPTFLRDTKIIDNIGKGTVLKTFLIYDHCTTQHWVTPSVNIRIIQAGRVGPVFLAFMSNSHAGGGGLGAILLRIWVGELTMPAELPPLVGEVSVNFWG